MKWTSIRARMDQLLMLSQEAPQGSDQGDEGFNQHELVIAPCLGHEQLATAFRLNVCEPVSCCVYSVHLSEPRREALDQEKLGQALGLREGDVLILTSSLDQDDFEFEFTPGAPMELVAVGVAEAHAQCWRYGPFDVKVGSAHMQVVRSFDKESKLLTYELHQS